MRILTWRGWLAVVLVGACSALLSLVVALEIRAIATERQQLREIVELIRTGRIQVLAPAPPVPPPSAERPK
jgi:hypothetical protein